MRAWRRDILGAAKLLLIVDFLAGKMWDAQVTILYLLGISLRSCKYRCGLRSNYRWCVEYF